MLEAGLNYIGFLLFDCWEENLERKLDTVSKYKLICEALGLKIDKKDNSFNTVKELFSSNIRNSFAHGKTYRKKNENLKNVTDTQEAISDILKKSYQSKELRWTSYIT